MFDLDLTRKLNEKLNFRLTNKQQLGKIFSVDKITDIFSLTYLD